MMTRISDKKLENAAGGFIYICRDDYSYDVDIIDDKTGVVLEHLPWEVATNEAIDNACKKYGVNDITIEWPELKALREAAGVPV